MPYFVRKSTEKRINWLSSMVGITTKSASFDPIVHENLISIDDDGNKIIKSGMIYPANDATAQGIVFEDVDVTQNSNAGSILVAGRVLQPRLMVETLDADAKAALEKSGIHFDDAPETVRDIDAPPEPTSIALSQNSVSGAAATTASITAEVNPDDADQTLDVTSSSATVATVAYNSSTKKYDISLKAAGTATITFTSHSAPTVKATVAVTVTA